MHYPPETSSIMLMAKMVAIVKQVSVFVWLLVQIITSCVSITPWKSQQCNSKLLMETPKFKKKTLKSFYAFFFLHEVVFRRVHTEVKSVMETLFFGIYATLTVSYGT